MIDWLIDSSFIDLLIDGLFLIDWLIHSFIIHWFFDWWIHSKVMLSTEFIVLLRKIFEFLVKLFDWFIHSFCHLLIYWLIHSKVTSEHRIDLLLLRKFLIFVTVWLLDWLIDCADWHSTRDLLWLISFYLIYFV